MLNFSIILGLYYQVALLWRLNFQCPNRSSRVSISARRSLDFNTHWHLKFHTKDPWAGTTRCYGTRGRMPFCLPLSCVWDCFLAKCCDSRTLLGYSLLSVVPSWFTAAGILYAVNLRLVGTQGCGSVSLVENIWTQLEKVFL